MKVAVHFLTPNEHADMRQFLKHQIETLTEMAGETLAELVSWRRGMTDRELQTRGGLHAPLLAKSLDDYEIGSEVRIKRFLEGFACSGHLAEQGE